MRKLLALLISATLMLSLVACGDSGNTGETNGQNQDISQGAQSETNDDNVQAEDVDDNLNPENEIVTEELPLEEVRVEIIENYEPIVNYDKIVIAPEVAVVQITQELLDSIEGEQIELEIPPGSDANFPENLVLDRPFNLYADYSDITIAKDIVIDVGGNALSLLGGNYTTEALSIIGTEGSVFHLGNNSDFEIYGLNGGYTTIEVDMISIEAYFQCNGDASLNTDMILLGSNGLMRTNNGKTVTTDRESTYVQINTSYDYDIHSIMGSETNRFDVMCFSDTTIWVEGDYYGDFTLVGMPTVQIDTHESIYGDYVVDILNRGNIYGDISVGNSVGLNLVNNGTIDNITGEEKAVISMMYSGNYNNGNENFGGNQPIAKAMYTWNGDIWVTDEVANDNIKLDWIKDFFVDSDTWEINGEKYEINGNANNEIEERNKIVISDGELILNDQYLKFGSSSEIIIKSGGRLIVRKTSNLVTNAESDSEVKITIEEGGFLSLDENSQLFSDYGSAIIDVYGTFETAEDFTHTDNVIINYYN